jgi:hypothetical protein
VSGRYNESRELFRRHMQRAHAHGPDDQGVIILNILEVVMSAIDGLQQDFDDYKQTVADAFAAQDQALTSALAKIADLGSAGVDPAQVQALSDDIAAAKQVAQAELAKVQSAAAPSPTQPATGTGGPTADPAGGTATPDPSAGTTPASGGSADPSGTAPATPAAPTRTVYLTTEDPNTIDVSAWPPSGLETAPTDGSAPELLYNYVGDVNPGDQNGAQVAGWTVYVGPTQAVPAA